MDLGMMKPGERGRVTGLARGEADYRKRLLALGVTPGVEFQITRVAPLGDPVEIRLRGFALSLRKHEAQLVRVELIDAPLPLSA